MYKNYRQMHVPFLVSQWIHFNDRLNIFDIFNVRSK